MFGKRGLGVALAALLLVASACGGSGTTTTASKSGGTGTKTQATTTYGPKDTIVDATDITDAVTLDPNAAYETSSVNSGYMVYSRLVTFPYGSMQKVQGQLASKWTISNNNKTYTFDLKHGIKFSSGNEVTAADVVYSFERIVNLPKDPAAWLITQMGITSKNVDQAVKATGKYTVTFNLPTTFSPGAFLAVMANNVAAIVDSKTVKAHVKSGDWGAAWLFNHSAGSGPYELKNWTKGVKIEFVPNPNYNLGNPPAVKHVLWENETETTTRMDMLKRGDADIAEGLTNAQVQSLSSDSNVKILKVPEEALDYVGMDIGNVPCFQKAQCLQAVKYSIDYKGIISKLLNGNGEPLQGVIPDGIFGYDSNQPFTYDVAKAKKLLAQAGFPKGFSATLTIPTTPVGGGIPSSALGDELKSNMAAAGINISLRQLQSSELYSEYRAHKLQMVLAGWGMDYPDPQDFAAPFGDYTQKSLIWRLQDKDKKLSGLVQQAAAMTNTPQRAALYKQINQLEYTTGPFALMYQPDFVVVYSKKLGNFIYDNANGEDFPAMTKSQ